MWYPNYNLFIFLQFFHRMLEITDTKLQKSQQILVLLQVFHSPLIPFFYLLQKRLGPLMTILKEHITHMEKDQLNNHQSELTSFFLSALDFRAQHCQVLHIPVSVCSFFSQ